MFKELIEKIKAKLLELRQSNEEQKNRLTLPL